MRKKLKITKKLLKKHNRTCGDCAYYSEQENDTVMNDNGDPCMIGICTFRFEGVTGNLVASGARHQDRFCGMAGRNFVPKGTKVNQPKIEREEPVKIEDMPLEELEYIKADKEIWSECTVGEKARISKQINKLKKDSNDE